MEELSVNPKVLSVFKERMREILGPDWKTTVISQQGNLVRGEVFSETDVWDFSFNIDSPKELNLSGWALYFDRVFHRIREKMSHG